MFLVVAQPPRPRFALRPWPLPSCFGVPFLAIVILLQQHLMHLRLVAVVSIWPNSRVSMVRPLGFRQLCDAATVAPKNHHHQTILARSGHNDVGKTPRSVDNLIAISRRVYHSTSIGLSFLILPKGAGRIKLRP